MTSYEQCLALNKDLNSLFTGNVDSAAAYTSLREAVASGNVATQNQIAYQLGLAATQESRVVAGSVDRLHLIARKVSSTDKMWQSEKQKILNWISAEKRANRIEGKLLVLPEVTYLPLQDMKILFSAEDDAKNSFERLKELIPSAKPETLALLVGFLYSQTKNTSKIPNSVYIPCSEIAIQILQSEKSSSFLPATIKKEIETWFRAQGSGRPTLKQQNKQEQMKLSLEYIDKIVFCQCGLEMGNQEVFDHFFSELRKIGTQGSLFEKLALMDALDDLIYKKEFALNGPERKHFIALLKEMATDSEIFPIPLKTKLRLIQEAEPLETVCKPNSLACVVKVE